MNKIVKPQLESYVWIAYERNGFSFSKVKVVAKGKEFFVHENCFNNDYYDDYRKPVYYDDYGLVWYKSLKEIRQKYKIKKMDDDYYEVIK